MSSLLPGVVSILSAPPGMLVAKATVLVLAGWAGALLLTRAAAAARHLVWLGAVIGLLVIPAFWVAPVRLAILPSVPGDVGKAEAPAPVNAAPLRSAPLAMRIVSSPDSANVLFAVWLTGAVGLVCWLMTGMLAVRRMLRGSRDLTSDWASRSASARIGLGWPPYPGWSRPTVRGWRSLAAFFDQPSCCRKPRSNGRRSAVAPCSCTSWRISVVAIWSGTHWGDWRVPPTGFTHSSSGLAPATCARRSERACDDLVLGGHAAECHAQQRPDLGDGRAVRRRPWRCPSDGLAPGELESRE